MRAQLTSVTDFTKIIAEESITVTLDCNAWKSSSHLEAARIQGPMGAASQAVADSPDIVSPRHGHARLS